MTDKVTRKHVLTITAEGSTWKRIDSQTFSSHSPAIDYLERWIKASKKELCRKEMVQVSINLVIQENKHKTSVLS